MSTTPPQMQTSRGSSNFSGWVLLAGSIVVILGGLLSILIPGPLGISGPGSVQSNVFLVVGGLLVLGGLPVLHRVQVEQTKTSGKIGVGLIWVGTVLILIILSMVQIYADVTLPSPIPPTIVVAPPLGAVILAISGAVLIVIGGIILGTKVIRGQNFPRRIGWLLIIGPVVALVSLPISDPLLSTVVEVVGFVIFFGGLAWAGARIGLSARNAPNPVA